MADLNNYSVIGRMTRDISGNDFAYTQNGKARLNLSIAVNDGYGENQYTSYFDVVVWGKTAENIKQYLTKGKQLCINGRLRQDRWASNDGTKHSRVCIIAETVQLLGGNSSAGAPGSYQQPQQQQTAADSGADFPEDIPF